MSIIDALVTDRTSYDAQRLKQLSDIGWDNMTVNQQHEWLFGNDNVYWVDGEIMSCLDGDIEIDGVSNKGAYNAVDLNRVGEAIAYLADRLHGYGYSAPVAPKTDWSVEDIPSIEQMSAYLTDVKTIRSVIPLLTIPPDAPLDMDALTHDKANDIERILEIVGENIDSIVKSFRRSGQFTFWSGNLPLPI